MRYAEEIAARRREAVGRAAEILAEGDAGCCWRVQFWTVASPAGQIKLIPAGEYPSGYVPVEFQIRWWQAVMDAAWREIVRLRDLERSGR